MHLLAEDSSTVYFGTYTGGESKGIYMADFDRDTGEWSQLKLAVETENPSFLARHPSLPVVYAVNETGDFAGEPGGGLTAFEILPETGQLKEINHGNTGGGAPCHLVVDKAGRHVLVANYSGGNVSSFNLDDRGRLMGRADLKQHQGSSVHPRQKGPHAHGIVLSEDQKYCFVPDLGLDKVLIYGFDPKSGKLSRPAFPDVSTAPGAGPRHFAFHPGQLWAYSINELDNTVTSFSYDKKNGSLKVKDVYPTLPRGYEGTSYTAEVVVSPDGRFVFGSNRGHDSIVVFAADPEDGSLKYVEHEPTGGKTPRHFAVSPDGKWLLAANQGSGTVVVFSIDKSAGKLTPTGSVLPVPNPVCVLF